MATHFYDETPKFDQDILLCLDDYGLKIIKTGKTFYWLISTQRLKKAQASQQLDKANVIFVRKDNVAVNQDQSGTHMRLEFSYFLRLGLLSHMSQEDADKFFGRDGSDDQRLNPNITGRTITNADLALLNGN